MLSQKLINKITNDTVFSVDKQSNGDYLISWYTDAGEDFSFTVSNVDDIIDYCDSFDPEEHATSWYGGRGAPGLRALLDDADTIAERLTELKNTVRG